MRQKDTGTPKKKTRRAAGQMVASAVMALAIAVGGFGTTALLASQPAGLTVEPSALLWEGETDAAHSTKKETKKNNTETPKNDSASSEAESTAASAAQPAAPSQSVKEEPAASAAPAAPAEETAAEPAAPETAPSAPMMGGIDELEQENGFPRLQQETEALAAEDPLSAPVEQDTVSQPAEPETNSEEQSTLPVKTEEGTILLTPEEIRAALDAGTLDASNIDTACLTDENGLLSWLWNLLFGKRDDDSSTPAPAPVYSGWRTSGGKTYYYSQTTNNTEPIDISGHSFVAVRNVSDHAIEVGGQEIAPGTGVTIGTRANRPEHEGIWYNLEGYYCYYISAFYPNLYSMQVSLDEDGLAVLNQNLTTADHWSTAFNCASFAAGLWNSVCSDHLSAGTPHSPKGLKASIRSYGGKLRYNESVPYDYIVSYGTARTPSADYS